MGIEGMLGILSLLLGGFQAINSGQAAGQARTLAQEQQKQQADAMAKEEQEKNNTQVQIGQNAQTAKDLATKAQMGPADSGFGGNLLQPISNATNPINKHHGLKLFGM